MNAVIQHPHLALIAAVARNGAVGKDNALLVHLPGDLPRFKQLTLGAAIIMGRKTFESIGRPLPGRHNIVLTRDPLWRTTGVDAASSFQVALALASTAPKVFVIGGTQAWTEALPFADELILTEIDADLDGDTFFPPWDKTRFKETAREAGSDSSSLRFNYVNYTRI